MSTSTVTRILMPRLSDSMEEGVIVAWLVSDGDHVRNHQEIVEVETDKATMPYETETAGVIHLRAAEGDTVTVGDLIAVIAPGEAPTEAIRGQEDTGAASSDGALPIAGRGMPTRANASPVARRMAAELGIDLNALVGSGPQGRVVVRDVRDAPLTPAVRPAAERPEPSSGTFADQNDAEIRTVPSAKGDRTTLEPSRAQRVIAHRMAQSKATAPDFALRTEVDMEAAVALRATLRGLIGEDVPLPSYNDLVVKACALALRETPLANGSYEDGRFELHGRVNVGIAVAAPGGLAVPTIFDADQKSLGEIARTSRALAERVRQGRITPPELCGGTFSISNLGMYGIDEFTAVINPPQAAILAVGTLKQRAVVRDGELAARHTMTISLSCDHRILYGANAAEFLALVRKLLEGPGALVL